MSGVTSLTCLGAECRECHDETATVFKANTVNYDTIFCEYIFLDIQIKYD